MKCGRDRQNRIPADIPGTWPARLKKTAASLPPLVCADDFRRPASRRNRSAGCCGSRRAFFRSPSPVQYRQSLYFEMVTSVTPFVRLLAKTKLPSTVTEVLRTMLPPPGIAQLWNFSVLGSKRTTVFGLVSDSLYQMMSLITEMPYGADLGPLGDCHSATLPLAGSRRPR